MISPGEVGTIMFVCRDRIPLWRVDVSSLFGKYLRRLGWAVRWHAVQPDGECVPNWMPHGALTSTRLKPGGLRSLRLWFGERVRDLRAALSLFRDAPCVVVIRDDYFSLAIVGIVARIKRVPCAYWMSFLIEDGYVEHGRQLSGFKGWVRRVYGNVYGVIGRTLLRNFAGMVFAQSEVMAEIVAGRMGFRRRIVPVHMAVDFEVMPTLDDAESGSVGELTIGYSGAISSLRGLDIALRGVSLARRRGIPVRLVMVGWYENAEDRAFRALIRELDLSNAIEQFDRCAQQEALAIVAKCDVAMSPCPSSPLYAPASPTKLFEYLALGKMVIATKHPAQDAVLAQAVGGWTVDETPESYADAISLAYVAKRQGRLAKDSARLREYCRRYHSYDYRAAMVSDEMSSFIC